MMLLYQLVTLTLSASLSATAANLHDEFQQYLGGHVFPSNKQPNIIFVFTDDQDLHMNSLDYMPYVKKHLIDEGTLFRRHYCTIALCCPSRVSLWTGKAAHNTNVTDVNPPYGGYPKFISQGFNEAYLPVWLQDAGYNTYYVGKLFNSHNVNNYDSPFPAGYTGSDFLLDPYTYEYLNATFQRNQDPPVSHEGEYSTDVLAGKAFGFLDDALAANKPFFLTVATNAPHSNVEFKENFFGGNISSDTIRTTPPVPAERHAHLFKDVKIPRTPNFNPDEPHGVSWIATLPKQNQTNVDFNDHFYRNRLRALQAVDEIVDGLIRRLDAQGILDDTYIFYSADNGYHIGQHRLQPGKECGYEEDINVPLIVRGPGVAKGHVSDLVTSHTDLAPTFLGLAGGEIRADFDGIAIPIHAHELEAEAVNNQRGEHVNIEYWGFALAEGKYDPYVFWNNTYKGLRLIGKDYNFYYSVWCSGEHELYDLNNDPYQTHNLYQSNHSSVFEFKSTTTTTTTVNNKSSPVRKGGREILDSSTKQPPNISPTTTLTKLLSRLDTLVLVLKTCKAQTCTHPWKYLHPSGSVHDLHDALDNRYNEFYEVEQQRVEFERCERGFILESEGPNVAVRFSGGVDNGDDDNPGVLMPRGEGRWSDLV